MAREITKIGIALVQGDQLLLVRKRGSIAYILPGGKPEQNEGDVAALCREIEEELGCRLDISSLVFLGSFADKAADTEDLHVLDGGLSADDGRGFRAQIRVAVGCPGKFPL